jgi:hypothetical protein
MITLFENYRNRPNIDLDLDFWKMVDYVNWNQLIKTYKLYPISDEHSDYFQKLQYKLYKKYDYVKIQNFCNIYNDIYYELYDYFESLMNKLNVSDDDYTDVISSIIGKGKNFTEHCISDDNVIINMVKTDDYVGNFGYLLEIDYDEYKELLTEYPKFGFSVN